MDLFFQTFQNPRRVQLKTYRRDKREAPVDEDEARSQTRQDYERFWMARASYQNEIDSAKEDGHATGLEEGHAAGLKEGRAAGQREIARQMLEHGEPIDKILRYSGLTADELTKLYPTRK